MVAIAAFLVSEDASYITEETIVVAGGIDPAKPRGQGSIGFHYLVDAGYANCPGFLAPFRGQQYHLSSWADGRHPETPEEFFNMKHASTKNVIERTFGLLKIRWKILASPSFYSLTTQWHIISACCLLHNFIRRKMAEDPAEEEEEEEVDVPSSNESVEDDTNNIVALQPMDEWTQF
ncbi:putative nuclease HARBI1 [Dioscorea cayenensis subsp. rotundata]|uniref:Nuclease HARBI1 n=1 Tax=Dioscorea cayennensis subsp. rotundata TaxID=55577 RepID=A0AB40B4U3_DIOCR|nr:putative nuclease HARBI1 [Dioscorea cayenensis subsp. rotundata]